MMRALITGAAGFIGHHVVEHLLKSTDWELVLIDKLTYASDGLNRLKDIKALDGSRVRMLPVDLSRPFPEMLEREIGQLDYVLHLAAETHVDRSIADPLTFVQANVVATAELLQFARRMNLRKFILLSTDEVFGPAPVDVNYKEWDRYNATNPYSATKAGAEQLVLAWANTYGLPVVICRTMNAFGERQHPEKFIPATVRKLLIGDVVTIHADAQRVRAGSRFYIHARNIADALLHVIQHTPDGKGLRDVYHIRGEREIDNLSLAMLLHDLLVHAIGHDLAFRHEMVDFHSSRPGHDLRYALDGQKLYEAGWQPPKTFEDSLDKTVRWMINPQNIRWLML